MEEIREQIAHLEWLVSNMREEKDNNNLSELHRHLSEAYTLADEIYSDKTLLFSESSTSSIKI